MQETITWNGKDIDLTCHACKRMAQRNVSSDELEFIMSFGTKYHRAGAVFFFLRKKDIPNSMCCDSSVSRLEGTTVVLSRDIDEVITVYRNRESGLHHIKGKSERSNGLSSSLWH